MCTAVRTTGLGTHHAVARIFMFFDLALTRWFIETWPSRSRVEFCRRIEQRLTATNAVVSPVIVRVPILAGESPLRAGFARHMILFRRKLLFPLGFGLH